MESALLSDFGRLMRRASDGSLPEISINFCDNESRNEAVAALIGMVGVSGGPCDFGTPSNNSHFLVKGVFSGCDIGVGVFEASLSLDFQTGKHWNDQAVEKLIALLKDWTDSFRAFNVVLDEDGEYFSEEARMIFDALVKS